MRTEPVEGLVEDYAAAVHRMAAAGRSRPTPEELSGSRAVGTRAAGDGVSLRTLTAGCLAAVERLLPDLLSATARPEVPRAAVTVVAAARRLLDGVAEGHAAALADAVRDEVGARRAFVDALLHGHGSPGRLAEHAERVGLALAGHHQVTVARADTPFNAEDGVVWEVESRLAARFGGRNVLVATDDGLLVCVTTAGLRGATGELAHHLLAVLGGENRWQVAVGRPQPGPTGVQRSYEEAREALHLADRLGLDSPVLRAADLLVFPVLLRDRAAMEELVDTVLAPLEATRGGAEQFLETLTAYFAVHGNVTATARRLRISPRAVSYRLERIRRVTGYDPDEPTQRFTLEAAVLGARLLDRPPRDP